MNGHFVFAVPGDLATPTGGYAYDRRLMAELASLGWTIDVVTLGPDFPNPSEQTLAEAEAILSAQPEGVPMVIDGLAFGAMPELAASLQKGRPLIALVHHPLALESGLTAEEAEALRISELMALATARAVIVTSHTTARALTADYAVPPERVRVAPPGIDPVSPPPRAKPSDDGRVHLLAVGAVVPRKGYDILLAALVALRDLPWRLTIAGACDRNIEASVQLLSDIVRFDLQDRVDALGPVSDEKLALLYADADLFVLASRHEGYGMVYAEAIAYGLPVIGTTAGAIPEVVPPAAGILVEPDSVAALTTALRRLIEDGEERRRRAAAARDAARQLPTWQDTALTVASVVEAAA